MLQTEAERVPPEGRKTDPGSTAAANAVAR
jgi:hypothetical protein